MLYRTIKLLMLAQGIILFLLPGVSYSATPFTDIDNMNNSEQPIADGDMGAHQCVYNSNSNHPVEFSISIKEHLKPKYTALLAIYAGDVDFPDEIDEVYINGERAGRLIGQNALSHTSLFVVSDVDTLLVGENIVRIYVDRNDAGWCLDTEKAHFILDEGFSTSMLAGIGNGPGSVAKIKLTNSSGGWPHSVLKKGENVDIEIRLANYEKYPVTVDMEAVILDRNGDPVSFYQQEDRKNITIPKYSVFNPLNNKVNKSFNIVVPDDANVGYNEHWTVLVSIYGSNSKLLRNTKSYTFRVSDSNIDWLNLKTATVGSTNSNLIFSKKSTLRITGRNLTPSLECWAKNENSNEYYKNVNFLYIFDSSEALLQVPSLPRGPYSITCTDTRQKLFGGEYTVKDTLPTAFHVTDTAYLLLHGLNSNLQTWDDVVDNVFGDNCFSLGAGEYGEEHLSPCYRLQFGSIAAEDNKGVMRDWPNGDGYTWPQLGSVTYQAVHDIYKHNKGYIKNLVLVGHSRGGIAARTFLQHQTLVNSVPFSKYGLVTIGTPHKGSPLGNIGLYLSAKGVDEVALHNSLTNDLSNDISTLSGWFAGLTGSTIKGLVLEAALGIALDAGDNIIREKSRFLVSPSVKYLAGSANTYTHADVIAGKPIAYQYLGNHNASVNTHNKYGTFYDQASNSWNNSEGKPWNYVDLNEKGNVNALLKNTGFIGQITSVNNFVTLNMVGSISKKLLKSTIGYSGQRALLKDIVPRSKLDTSYCGDKKWLAASWACNGDGIVPYHSQHLKSLVKLATGKDEFIPEIVLNKTFHTSETGEHESIAKMFNKAERNLHNSGGDVFE